MNRRFLTQRVMIGGLLSVALLGIAGPFGELSLADVRDTKHNLVKRPGQKPRDVDSKDVCVFCHFPSVGAVDEVGGPVTAPKWQRSISLTHAFSIYDDIGRTESGGDGPVGSLSVACLACHDANQAFVVTALNYDHPYGVPYRGSRLAALPDPAASAPISSASLRMLQKDKAREFKPAYEGTLDGRKIFWASSQANSYRRGKSDLPLYGRQDKELGDVVPFVECTSCHDPHSSNPLFLRVSNTGNQLCMTCHDK